MVVWLWSQPPQEQTLYNPARAGCIHTAGSLVDEWRSFAHVDGVSSLYVSTSPWDSVNLKTLDTWPAKELKGTNAYLCSDTSSYVTARDF